MSVPAGFRHLPVTIWLCAGMHASARLLQVRLLPAAVAAPPPRVVAWRLAGMVPGSWLRRPGTGLVGPGIAGSLQLATGPGVRAHVPAPAAVAAAGGGACQVVPGLWGGAGRRPVRSCWLLLLLGCQEGAQARRPWCVGCWTAAAGVASLLVRLRLRFRLRRPPLSLHVAADSAAGTLARLLLLWG